MTGFLFSNRFDSGNYYGGLIQGESALDQRLLGNVAFVVRSGKGVTDYSLEQAWAEKSGAILLLGQQAPDPEALANKVLKRLVEPGIRLIWIANPEAEPAKWNTAVFPLKKSGESLVLKREVDLHMTGEEGGYLLRFAKGVALAMDESDSSLGFSSGAISFGRDGILSKATGDALRLALAVPSGPAMQFGFAIPGGEALVAGLDALYLGFWYSTTAGNGPRKAFRYPLFQSDEWHDGLTCEAQLTPSRLLDPAVSRIVANPSSDPQSKYVTWFRSVFGRSTIIKAERPLLMVFNATDESGYGLSPDGSFTFRFSDQAVVGVEPESDLAANKDRNFACGAAGTECIVVPEAAKETLTLELVAGHPASVKVEGEDFRLSSDTTTAWVRLSAAVELQYEAQPAGQGTLYDATAASEPPVPILPYFRPIPVPILAGEAAPLLPMVPLAGLEKGAERLELSLEVTAIAPARKAELNISEIKRQAAGGIVPILPTSLVIEAGEIRTAITPRGMEATFDDTGWVSVQIARLLGILPGNSGNLRFAGDKGIVDPLKSALQTSQQFLVISDPEAIKAFFSDREPPAPPTTGEVEREINTSVTLRDWEFLLGPETWGEHGTILIIKNTQVAMQSLLADTGAWTSATEFNKDVAAVSRKLLEIAKNARASIKAGRKRMERMIGGKEEAAPQDLDFFVNTVLDSPEWNGFLFLNAKLGKFPQDLAGMRAGIDSSRLYAHHVGVTQTPFTTLAKLQNRSSSMFGLIRYDDKRKLTGNGITYTFRVRELGVLFAESDIRDFRSTVNLAIGKVFGQRSKLHDGTPAVSEMIGTRHLRGDDDAYSFTAIDQIELFLAGGPLQKVVLLQGEFVTKSVAPDIVLDGMTLTSLNFAGWLEFDAVKSGEEVYDVFSFEELAFSNLSINMDFRNDQPEKPIYTFSIEDLELSEALSKARKNSLFEGFPIKLDKLVQGSGKPGSQGNMTVQLPETPKQLPGDWFGISQILDMGTLSDVAGAAGLEARLLTAWGRESGQYYVGLNLSGPSLSGLGVELNLLSVLKLKAYALTLRRREGQWTLMMHGMSLSVFSKTLPPGGAFEFYIFGVPDPSGSSNSLGWYGAWIAEEDEKGGKESGLNRFLADGLPESMPVLTHSPRLRFRGAPNNQGD